MTEIYEWLNAAEEIAPTPTTPDATREDWARHYAALGLAAHAAFRDQLPRIPIGPRDPASAGSMPELGYLSHIASAATAAVCGLLTTQADLPEVIWNFTPEQGALNGEYIDYLAETLAWLGINPAKVYPWFDAGDFEVAAKVEG